MVLRSSPTGGSNDLKRLYLLIDRRRAPHARHQHAVLRHRRIERLVARAGRQARRQGAHPRRRGSDRRQAGEVRQPLRLPAVPRPRHRDLRVPADDDAREGDGGGRIVEHVRLGELRQSIARAERRDERRGQRSRPGGPAAPGLRAGPARARRSSTRPSGGAARSSKKRASTSGATSGKCSRDRGSGSESTRVRRSRSRIGAIPDPDPDYNHQMPPRVRFAPSPTGYLHVGGARTALFNWLFARRHGGTFVLRIEDTDAERSSWEMVAGIVDGLRWLGLDWDEGPDVGGPHAPYFQSQRLNRAHILAQHARRRAASRERARPGPTTGRDAVSLRRWRRSPARQTRFEDLVHGAIAFDNANIEDFVILRSDGQPTYHLSVVVDDIDMAITHVVRGDDHISNTPKQVLLYEAFGRPAPQFAHVPLIMGPDKKRLSKRHGATSVTEYQRLGYLPEAMVNFLALLGWSPGGDREVLSRDELRRCSRSKASAAATPSSTPRSWTGSISSTSPGWRAANCWSGSKDGSARRDSGATRSERPSRVDRQRPRSPEAARQERSISSSMSSVRFSSSGPRSIRRRHRSTSRRSPAAAGATGGGARKAGAIRSARGTGAASHRRTGRRQGRRADSRHAGRRHRPRRQRRAVRSSRAAGPAGHRSAPPGG